MAFALMLMKTSLGLLLILLSLSAQRCLAADELVTTAHYANPGGSGIVDPRMGDGKLVYGRKENFLLGARPFIVDDEFATVTTNSTQSEERIQAVLDDIKSRFPHARIYLMGTSNGTGPTLALAGYLADKIAGAEASHQKYGNDFIAMASPL
jgi:hypothetical protein